MRIHHVEHAGLAGRVAEVGEAQAFGGGTNCFIEGGDLLDGDGFVVELGFERARALADERAARVQALLTELAADTSVLAELTASVATRTA